MSEAKPKKQLLRGYEGKTGGIQYRCTMCNADMTAAVEIYGRDMVEAKHRATHYMEVRDRVIEYAKRCHQYTKLNPDRVDMTAHALLVGAVQQLLELSDE